jgi:periplasmic protein TonB
MKIAEKKRERASCLDDIVFEGRNKEYGAYYIRHRYPKTLLFSLVIINGLFVGILLSYFYGEDFLYSLNYKDTKTVTYNIIDLAKIEGLNLPEEEPKEELPPIKSKEPIPQVVDTINKEDQSADTNKNNTEEKTDSIQNETNATNTLGNTNDTIDYVEIDKMPEFPGGFAAVRRYITDNIIYPKALLSKKITGFVQVRFCVTKEGLVSKISVIKSLDPLADEEAIRVLKSMPRWKPGISQGKHIDIWFTLPIYFIP